MARVGRPARRPRLARRDDRVAVTGPCTSRCTCTRCTAARRDGDRSRRGRVRRARRPRASRDSSTARRRRRPRSSRAPRWARPSARASRNAASGSPSTTARPNCRSCSPERVERSRRSPESRSSAPGRGGDELWARSPYLALDGRRCGGMARADAARRPRVRDGRRPRGALRTADPGARPRRCGDHDRRATVPAEQVEARLATLPGVRSPWSASRTNCSAAHRGGPRARRRRGARVIVAAARPGSRPWRSPGAGSCTRCRARDSGKVARGVLRDAVVQADSVRAIRRPSRPERIVSAADRSPVIVAARRTAIATAGLPAHRGRARRAGPRRRGGRGGIIRPGRRRRRARQLHGPGGDVARVAALRAGLGIEVPGVTVDRQCGSGLDAVMQAASRVRAGDAALVIAGGAESASTAPHRLRPDTGERYTRAPFAPSGFADPDMGPAAEHLARVRGITRARQDAWAARSHARRGCAGRGRVRRRDRARRRHRTRRPAARVDGRRAARALRAGVRPASASLARRGWRRHVTARQLVRVLRRRRRHGRHDGGVARGSACRRSRRPPRSPAATRRRSPARRAGGSAPRSPAPA